MSFSGDPNLYKNLSNSLKGKGPLKSNDAIMVWTLIIILVAVMSFVYLYQSIQQGSVLMGIISISVIVFLIYTYRNLRKGYSKKK